MNLTSAPQCKSEPPAPSAVEALIARRPPVGVGTHAWPLWADEAASMLRSLSREHALAVSTFIYQSRKIARLQKEIATLTQDEADMAVIAKAAVERAEKAEAALAASYGSKSEA